MDLLIVEPLEAEVMHWLEERHVVVYAPELARDPLAFRRLLPKVKAMIVPPAVPLDRATLRLASRLRAVGRVSGGAENLDLEACSQFGIDVVRSNTATALAEAEFMIGALLAMLRRVPVLSPDGLRVGRELGGSTVGLIGMMPSARSLVQILSGFGSRVVGYDPALHPSDGLWARWRVEPLGLRELMEQADAVCVQLTYYSRYHGLLGHRVLPTCRENQVVVCVSPSTLFDETALAEALGSGRMAAAWLDCLEPGTLDAGRPLHGIENLQVTPHVASTTRQSRSRSAWAVAKRIDEILNEPGDDAAGLSAPGELLDLPR